MLQSRTAIIRYIANVIIIHIIHYQETETTRTEESCMEICMQNNSSCICLAFRKTHEDADVCEGSSLVHLAEIQNALQRTNLTKFSKISINSYKNKPEEGSRVSYIPSSTVSRHAVCREAACGLLSVMCVCVFVCFSRPERYNLPTDVKPVGAPHAQQTLKVLHFPHVGRR